MSIFMKPKTQEYSVVDPIKPGFDPAIIVNDKIRSSIRDKILNMVSKISSQIGHEVDKLWVVGSTVTSQWKPNSDIDVTVFLKKQLDGDQYKELNTLAADNFNEKLFVNEHPVNFYFSPNRYLKFKADAIYDLSNEKWIKKPEALSEDDIEEIIKNCSSLKEFNQILKEYMELKNLLENFNGEKDELKDIIDQTVKVSILFNKIRDVRREEFNKKPDPDLPSANYRCSNIVYKLLENYGLGDIVEEVTNFLDSRLEN